MRLATLRSRVHDVNLLLRQAGLVVELTENTDDNIDGELSILHLRWDWSSGSLVLGCPGQENSFFPMGLSRWGN